MTEASPTSALADVLRRWANENVADTRRADGPEPRVYEIAFAEVWDELLGYVQGRPRWTLLHKDEELGLMSVTCTSLVFRFVDDLTIWVTLDANGLTRVEALSRSRVGKGDLGMNRRRIERMLRALDEAFGASRRVAGVRRRGAGEPGLPPPGDGASRA